MKEFSYSFAELGKFFTTSWTAKKLEFSKAHGKEIEEEMLLENLTAGKLEIKIEKHALLKHPAKVMLKPKEAKLIKIMIPCGRIKGKHKSSLIIRTKKQAERAPIIIRHIGA